MIWAIAIRNLWQHKTKTIIVGMLVAIGVTLTFAGNALIDSMIRNISGIFTEYYTGEILVTSTETLGAGVFGAQSDDVVGFPVIPVIKDFEQVMRKVEAMPGIKAITTQLSGYAMINLEEKGMDFSLFFGIEPDGYFPAMNGLELVEGRRLQGDEDGMLLSYEMWKNLKDNKDTELRIGDTLQLNSFGSAGVRISEVPVVGIYRFPQGNNRMFPMSFVNARTLRYLLGRSGGVAEKVVVPKAATALLDADIDSMFDDGFFDSLDLDEPSVSATSSTASASTETTVAESAAVPDNWHFIVIRVEPGQSADALIKKLNDEFDNADLLARAQGWWVSAMPDSLTYSGVQVLFNVAIFILGFVSIIIIMNTLVVSVMERTSEIGTMRALGAQKSFVTRMFIAETGFITLVFGGFGLLCGALIIGALNSAGIPTDNDALRYLGGGGVLRPTISAQPVIMSLVLMGIIGLFSWIYPVLIALKVSPLKAISTE